MTRGTEFACDPAEFGVPGLHLRADPLEVVIGVIEVREFGANPLSSLEHVGQFGAVLTLETEDPVESGPHLETM